MCATLCWCCDAHPWVFDPTNAPPRTSFGPPCKCNILCIICYFGQCSPQIYRCWGNYKQVQSWTSHSDANRGYCCDFIVKLCFFKSYFGAIWGQFFTYIWRWILKMAILTHIIDGASLLGLLLINVLLRVIRSLCPSLLSRQWWDIVLYCSDSLWSFDTFFFKWPPHAIK